MIRHLKGEDLNSLNPKELIPIEDALQIGLTSVRDKQVRSLLFIQLTCATEMVAVMLLMSCVPFVDGDLEVAQEECKVSLII